MKNTGQLAESIVRLLEEGALNSQKTRLADGQVAFSPGDRADKFYIVESGEIHVYAMAKDGGKRLLDIFGPKDCFGFTALGRLPTYGKLTKSVGESVLHVIDADHLRQVLASRSDLTLPLVETMAKQLYLAWAVERDYACADCRERLIHALLRFRDSPVAQQVPGGVELHMTHAQLAEAIGVVRETVSVCLIQLRIENLVQTGRNRIFFNPQDLSKLDPQAESLPDLKIAI
jgi:CRP-like cAMP-binding protein